MTKLEILVLEIFMHTYYKCSNCCWPYKNCCHLTPSST